MIRIILRQFTVLALTLFVLTVLAFSLAFWFPGNAITNASGVLVTDIHYQAVATARAFDKNIISQYLAYMAHFFAFDWGVSLQDGASVWQEFKLRFPATLELSLLAMALALLLGPPLGILAAMHHNKPIDQIITFFSLSGYSIPVFWMAQLSILIFAVALGWVPIAGQVNPLFDIPLVSGSILVDIWLAEQPYRGIALLNALQHMILPVIVLATVPLVLLIRLTRNACVDVLRLNFVKGAYARGLSTPEVLFKHVIPNTMQEVTLHISTAFSLLITNTLIIEMIFSWPGLGRWLVRSIYERDYPVIQGVLLLLASLILLVNVATTIFHAWRFPRVRRELNAT
ncbi:ABC transporter permease [Aliidiomarina quisquiliarum]|uniref:ABC transporter permease n=1 Tax=Aliidiomarina quisquiliarum TaxID=2938947 RepID=UPI00208EBBF5|nr:ABC transporter permease [Aliidiomarina quisquiliarum]MCO4320608.1 ABC transporter permease [Aliidiomarina quisquiliarum]